MDWFQKITITCFAASYAVALAIELLRIRFSQSAVRSTIKIAFVVAGVFAHSVFLAYHTNLSFDQYGVWLGSWFGWSLAGAWVLAIAYLWLLFQKYDSTTGIFVLPVVLVLISWGSYVGSETVFSAEHERTIWNMIHGITFLLGTVIVALGFVFGLMYLFQVRRLKSKSIRRTGQIRLPSLEWLQQYAERSLIASACLFALGLVSGIALNLSETADGKIVIPWQHPVVWSSAALCGWLVVCSFASQFYRPVRNGRKVALLVMFSFFFLVFELGLVWWFDHATEAPL